MKRQINWYGIWESFKWSQEAGNKQNLEALGQRMSQWGKHQSWKYSLHWFCLGDLTLYNESHTNCTGWAKTHSRFLSSTESLASETHNFYPNTSSSLSAGKLVSNFTEGLDYCPFSWIKYSSIQKMSPCLCQTPPPVLFSCSQCLSTSNQPVYLPTSYHLTPGPVKLPSQSFFFLFPRRI